MLLLHPISDIEIGLDGESSDLEVLSAFDGLVSCHCVSSNTHKLSHLAGPSIQLSPHIAISNLQVASDRVDVLLLLYLTYPGSVRQRTKQVLSSIQTTLNLKRRDKEDVPPSPFA